MLRQLLTISGLLVSATLVGGCAVPVIVGTAGVAGTGAVAADKRTLGTMVEDEGIEWKIRGAIHEAGLGNDDRHNVNVTSFNRIALLTGQVPDEDAKRRAGAEASGTAQVRGVHNELVVGKPISLATRSADTVITGRVKLALVNTVDLRPPTNVNTKVVTEDGAVFLMGLVTRRQAEAITAAVRKVPGVRQIVRLFEYPDA